MKRILLMPFLAFVILMLNGCSTLPPQAPPSSESWQQRKQKLRQITRWKINGKIAVRSAQDSGSATVDWQQTNRNYTISLFGPLGSYHMQLTGKPGSVALTTTDGKTLHAPNAEELLAANWGFELPVSSLYYWVRTLPAPGTTFRQKLDAYHRVKSLTQGPWQIDYLRYTRLGHTDLPTLIRVKSPQLTAKLVIYDWKV